MKRGLFQEIIPEEFINSSTRNWNISLLKSLDIWGKVAYSDGKLSNYKRTIKRHIVNYIYPNDDFDSYPIYFISIRPKTRFNKFVKFLSADRKYFTLTFFEGLIPHFKKFNVEDITNFLDIDCKNGVTLQVESKYVVCSNGAEKKVVSIYDLLHAFGYHFKLKNKILYVGYSENPENRPFEGFHGGLTQILYGVFNRNMNDIFINYQQSYKSSKDFEVFAEFVVFVVAIIFPYKYLSPLLKIPQANRLYHSTYIVQKYLPHSPDLFFLLYQPYSKSTY